MPYCYWNFEILLLQNVTEAKKNKLFLLSYAIAVKDKLEEYFR